ncbi:high mobility group protein Z [Xenorhabdus sp. 12]|uniref:High mobility group protein Z n=1 Tax=Xenorhabdus santafensis TaxID=2582833 RepID=A0ABU4S672_9GAMM|nr:high mobility group protein Z [Xenorhabdus sp. 12]MDX7986148.1 high mobility group protein Z [Xenorhabdus sp. 12]
MNSVLITTVLITTVLVCYLLWLLGKLWRLSRRKRQLRNTIMTQRFNSMKKLRFDGRKQRKE